jgi:hypothetical protein
MLEMANSHHPSISSIVTTDYSHRGYRDSIQLRAASIDHNDLQAAPETGVAVTNAEPTLREVSTARQVSVLLSAFLATFVTIGINQSYAKPHSRQGGRLRALLTTT